MKLAVSIIALILAIGFGVFTFITVSQAEVTINTDTAQGVYNLETNEFNGIVSGWSSNKGFGSAFAEIKEQANSAHNTRIAMSAGGAAAFLILGSALLISEVKARKSANRAESL